MLFNQKRTKQTIDISGVEPEVKQYIDNALDELERQRLEKERLEQEERERRARNYENGIRFSYKTRIDEKELDSNYHEWEKKTAVRETFSVAVLRIMGQKKLTPSKLYKKAGLDRKLFSRLRNDYMYQPSRTTAIKFCLGLELEIAEAENLLEIAGFSLSKSQSFDLIIRYCIEHGYTDIDTVNEILRRFEEKEL